MLMQPHPRTSLAQFESNAILVTVVAFTETRERVAFTLRVGRATPITGAARAAIFLDWLGGNTFFLGGESTLYMYRDESSH